MTNNVMMNFDLNAIRLQHAVLCVDCDVISDSPNDACLVCGSRSLLPLARVLGVAERVAQPVALKQPEHRPEVPVNVLVLVPPVRHRSRQRTHPGV